MQHGTNLLWILGAAHWAETDYGLSTGQHAVLLEGKGKVRPYTLLIISTAYELIKLTFAVLYVS